MSGQYAHHKPHRSFFWPVILIGAGVIWLLSNLGIIPAENLWILIRLWPVLIIVAGLNVLFAQRKPLVGAILALLLIAGVVVVLLNGDTLNLRSRPEPATEIIELAAGNTAAVNFDLNLSHQRTRVYALTYGINLIEAELLHYGAIDFTATGGEEKEMRLEQTSASNWFTWISPEIGDQNEDWRIGLHPEIPFELHVDASTGRLELDLVGMQLSGFQFNGSTGASTINLPASTAGYEARIDASVGPLDIVLPGETSVTLRLDGSVGRIRVSLPDDAAVQIEVMSDGIGQLILPDWITKVSGIAGQDEGVYQSEGFESEEFQLNIIIEDISVGNIVVE